MKKLLIVVDMQNDFVSGSLGTPEAVAIVKNVEQKVIEWEKAGGDVIFTRDTHGENYLDTQEGKNLPVVHCVKGTPGWEIIDVLKPYAKVIFDKPTFGSTDLAKAVTERVHAGQYDEVELIGLCTDICVVSNALLLKACLPELPVSLDASCCAGVTPQSHNAAIDTMKMCQVAVH